ncbi:MAG: M48 family metalloprotease [Planctomycetota bacterium]|nr:M48 family metalloprotease [Planctomycetota bacterium]
MGLFSNNQEQPRRSGCTGRLLIGAVIAVISLVSYFGTRSANPVTGKVQHVGITPSQEIALGLQAAPEMASQYGGESPDAAGRQRVDAMGRQLLSHSTAAESPYKFEFHLLADATTINAFALPGGQVFITKGLFDRLQTEGQLAGVLGHEMGHVIERHSAQQIAKAQLTQGLTGAAAIATYDPNDPSSRSSAAVAMMIGQLVNLRFSRTDELQADDWGVTLTAASGYDPRAMVGLMKVLEDASHGRSPPEFFSTHPNPENRISRIEAAIQKQFPEGLPAGLKP